MTLARQITQKLNSLAYKVRARRYKRSPRWIHHPHNHAVSPTDWKRVDEGIARVCAEHSISFADLPIPSDEYALFKGRFRLPPWSLYALHCREKKLLEHFIAFRLLDLPAGSRYIDIASENSPFPDLARDRFGWEVYSQDLTYPAGVHGNRIGSSADQLPISANWIDGASLQCAFEHFQGNIDSNFVRELARVLKPGGRCVIVPLYMHHDPLNIYDPLLYHDWNDEHADPGVTIVGEIELGGHFERLYSPETLNRVFIPGIGLHYRVFRVSGIDDIARVGGITAHDNSLLRRVRYALLIEKAAPAPAQGATS